ncbi:cis-zeatin O-glucosyltransferase 2-like [Dioscorea cayenensis subsp. rotundata]|uniref:Cis-zeatin O-glucosyltransferase 2-like n=1 Tax=Dioscorea cayennensis subsp. rotundata TaxID=55577 RepID=A0AB40CBU9_DIOCR|nr:cis-zeatin O-glucosyltransferase 2-like [Dioscorea cayenensis subsp. rotundata]
MELPNRDNKIPILVVPFPAQGHLNTLLHFSLLLSSHGLPVHFASSSIHNNQARHRLRGWTSASLHNITFHDIPIPSLPPSTPNPNSTHSFPSHLVPIWEFVIHHLRSPLSSLLHSLSASSPLILIYDPLMSFVSDDAASIPSIHTFNFQCVPANFILSYLYEGTSTTWSDNDILFSPSPSPSPLQDTVPEEVINFSKKHYYETPCEGMLFNTSLAIEGAFIDLLAKQDDFVGKKIFAVGPVSPLAVSTDNKSGPRHPCLEWLDKQPPKSVVYVAFGSSTTIPVEQIEQIALGLEKSKQRFIWVVRDADRGDVSQEAEPDHERVKSLLLDFEKRVEGMGMVVRGWAPQLDILAHGSTAAFMSHCGWNSCMEGMSMGVAMLTWPIHSEQPRNALLITEYLKVGVMVREWEKRHEVLKWEKVDGAIQKVMVDEEGLEIRRRAKELGEKIRDSIEGGSSYEQLLAFINYISGFK